MANARSHFDMISSYLQRMHDAQAGLLYGKPCLMQEGRAFAAYQPDAMAFHLHGRALAQALTLPGASGWDPLHPDQSSPGWVLLPATQALRWDRLALEALRCEKEAIERRVSYAPAPAAPAAVEAPPASTPQGLAQRVSAALSSGLRSLTLSDPE
jgi:hypothetical protein